MSKKMLIDAAHPEETRVVVVDGTRVEEFDFESQAKRQLRGNIYLARVTRVEPSLQAAFIEYGGNRHGFLAFNEIHPDYYQIPFEDRQKILDEERADDGEDTGDNDADADENGDSEDDDAIVEAARRRRRTMRRYKIQEVIKRRQILLVQVVKEERGNKGAALTTYISLAGRYGVLMPNTARGGGISRKITSATDRNRLRKIVDDLEVPDGMGLIVRTAGSKRTKAELKRDYEYLVRLWESIRERTLSSIAPCLIHEEGNLVKRSVRDLYDKDIEAIEVEGDEAYREAKDFIKMLMPSHAKKVQPYRGAVPVFLKHQIENQLEQIYDPVVTLKSGGYLVINQTEALVAIDVNSGRSTRERNIEATALKTNLEAADEACRQFRLRDLAGLLVIDFIDMDEAKNNRAVEKRMAAALKRDRARVQHSKISSFGLMEMSRQRRRASILEGSTQECGTCRGRGMVRSVESSALHVLRRIEEEGVRGRAAEIVVKTASEISLYLLNEKRPHLNAVEERYAMRVLVQAEESLIPPDCEIEITEERDASTAPALVDVQAPAVADDDVSPAAEDEEASPPRKRRRRRRRSSSAAETEPVANASEPTADASETAEDAPAGPETTTDDPDRPRRKRRRGRRGGRGRRSSTAAETPEGMEVVDPAAASAPREETLGSESVEAATDVSDAPAPAATEAKSAAKPRKPRARPRRKKPEPAPETDAGVDSAPVVTEDAAAPPPQAPAEPRIPETVGVEIAQERDASADARTAAPSVAAPAEAAPDDPDAEERRERWQNRIKNWLGS